MNENIKRVLDILVYDKIIPENGIFDITDLHINKYIEYYSSIHKNGNNKFDAKYARKLAGLNLLKFKIEKGETFKSCKEGLVYIIENSAFQNHLKVGMTIDLTKRLKTYQTYDPLKRFKILTYDFVLNRRHTEEKVLNSFNIKIESGEWIEKKNINELIKIISASM